MKRDCTFTFRVRAETKKAMIKEAEYFGTTPGQLTALLVEQFVKSRKESGDQVAYPPRFQQVEIHKEVLRI